MKKIKMPLSSLIINIVVAVLVITSAVLVIVGHTKSNTFVINYTKLSFILMLIAMVAFIALTNVATFFKKFQMYILIPVLVIYFTLSTIVSFFMLNISAEIGGEVGGILAGTGNQVFELAILALLIVSIIFALKGKKWATIITIVLLSLDIYSIYSLIIIAKPMFKEAGLSDTILMLYGLGIVLVAEVVYFVSLLYPKAGQQAQETPVTKEVISEQSVTEEVTNEEPVINESAEPETINPAE